MAYPLKTYKTDKGVYEIPEKESASFLKDFPNAMEVVAYKKGKDTFDIPVKEAQSFIQENPDAIPVKKKVESIGGLQEPSDGGLNGTIPTITQDELDKQDDVIGKIQEADALSKKTRFIGMDGGGNIPDFKAQSQAKEIHNQIKGMGYGDKDIEILTKTFSDLPKEAETTTVVREGGVLDTPYSKKSFLELYKIDPKAAVTKANAVKNYFDLKKSAGEQVAQQYNRLQNVNDPDKSINENIDNFYINKEKQKELIGKNLPKEQQQKALDRVEESSDIILTDIFNNPENAKGYIVGKLKEKDANLDLANPTLLEQQGKADNDLSKFTLQSIADNLDPKNKAEKLAFRKYKYGVDLDNSVNSSADLNEAALKFAAEQNPTIKGQIEKLGGTRLPNAYEGEIVNNFLNNPDVIQKAQNDPDFAEKYNQAKQNLYFNYPDFAKKEVATKISQAREDKGMNNWFANVPTQEATDKLVEDMVRAGKMTEQDKLVYDTQIKKDLGVWQSIKRGAGRIPFGAFIEESPIQTPGLLESTENAFNKSIHGVARSVEDIVGMDKNVFPDKERLYNKLQSDASTASLIPKSILHEVAMGTGNLAGFVIPMMAGGVALKGVKGGEFIANGLLFEGENKDKALTMFPDEPTKQYAYTALATAGDVMLGHLIPKGDAAKGIAKTLKSDIVDVVNKFTNKEISAAEAKKTLLDKATSLLGDLAKENTKVAGTITGFGIFHNTLDALFDKNDMGAGDIATQAVKDFKSNFLTTPLLAAMAVKGKSSGINGKVLMEVADNPELYKKLITEQSVLNTELKKTEAERLANLEDAAAIKKDLDKTEMTDKQKQDYMVTAINKKILERKAAGITDKALKQEVLNEAEKHDTNLVLLQSKFGDKEFKDLTPEEKETIEVPKGSTVKTQPSGTEGKFTPLIVNEKGEHEVLNRSFDTPEAAKIYGEETIKRRHFDENIKNKTEEPIAEELTPEVTKPTDLQKGVVTVSVKLDGKNIDAKYLDEYKGHKIVEIDGDVYTYDPKKEVLFKVALDDSKSTGSKKVNPEANNVETAKQYIDWKEGANKENKFVKPIDVTPTDVVTEKGKMEGSVTDNIEVNNEKVYLPEKGFLISSVSLNEGQQKGKGSGQELYKKALDEHGILYSVFPVSEDALRVQDKLVEKGIAKIENITLSDGTEIRKITKGTPTDVVGSEVDIIDYPELKETKVIDDNGNPEPVYHFTNNEFKDNEYRPSERQGVGMFTSSSKEFASAFGKNEKKVLLNIKNPKDLTDVDLGDFVTRKQASKILGIEEDFLATPKFPKEAALWEYMDEDTRGIYEQQGYDGIIGKEEGNPIQVTFRPEQIISIKSKSENKPVNEEPKAAEVPNPETKAGITNEPPPENIGTAETGEEGSKKVGVSHKSLTDLAKRLGLKEPETGEWHSPEWYAERGRQLLEAGANPEEVNNPNNELHDRISIARANLENLVKEADVIAREKGIDSKEYEEAHKKVNDYANDVVKKLGTKAGQAMTALQGERDIDTDSFTAVKKAAEEGTGKPLNKEQEKKIQELTTQNKELKKQTNDLEKKLVEATDKALNGNKPEQDKGKFEKKARELSKKIMDSELPSWLKIDDPNASTKGMGAEDLKKLLSEATINMGKLLDKGVEFAEAVKEAVKDLVDKLGEDKRDEIEKGFTEHYKGISEPTVAEKNIARLEKELENLQKGIAKQKNPKRDLTDKEKELKEQIKEERANMGLEPSKMDKPKTEQEQKEEDAKELEDIQKKFVDKKDNKFSIDEAKDIFNYAKKNYLDKDVSFSDMLARVSNDLGLSWRQVSDALTSPKVKPISDAMWKKRADYMKNRTATKNWVESQSKSVPLKALRKVSSAVRGVAVFGHGGIFIGTHAGMTLFNPSQWNKVIPAFIRGWKFAYGNRANYERRIEQLRNDRNYVIAQRGGLKNNPDVINTEEFQKSQEVFKKIGGEAGIKGFNAIKVLRQDLFNYHYDRLSEIEKNDPESIEQIAKLVNNATGATNLKLPEWVNETTFAGGMEAARWGKLTRNPARAAAVALKAIVTPEKATTAERVFAKVWARRVGEQLGTMTALLMANAALQNTINPKNPTNLTNPNDPDFLKFKFGNLTIDPTSGMRGVAMFMYGMGKVPFKTQKELKGDTRLQAAGKSVFGYGRGKLAPLYSTVADFVTQQDYNKNPLPFSKDKPTPGHHKLTWGEYLWQKAPLPVAEAATVTYKSAEESGADKVTLRHVFNGFLSGAISGGTGFRVSEYDKEEAKHSPFTEEDNKNPIFKYFLDKWMELPHTNLSSEEITDEKNRTKKKVSDYPKDIQDKYEDTHKLFLKKELSDFKRKGYVFTKEYLTSDGETKVEVYTDKKPHSIRKSLDSLDKDELAQVLRIAQSQATRQAKKKVFNQK